MTAFQGHSAPIIDVLTAALDQLGDLSKARVTLIDDVGDFNPGNQKAAQLLEIFNTPAQGNAPQEVTIVTRYLGQDSEQGFQVTGVPAGFVRSDTQKGELQKRFREVSEVPFNVRTFPLIAEKMVAESALPKNMREGLWAIMKEHMQDGAFKSDSGLGNLRGFVNGYLNRPMTPQWEKELMDSSPVGRIVDTMQKGTCSTVAAPATARFTKRITSP